MAIRIGVASDLHLEMSRGLHPASGLPECELLLLCGDVAVGEGVCEVMRTIDEAGICEHLLWVAGNHEFYRGDLDGCRAHFKAAFVEHPRVHFLDDSVVELCGLTVVGATLWSGFDVLGEQHRQQAMATAHDNVADFSLIGRHGEPFTPEQAAVLHAQAAAFIEQTLAASDPARSLVMTHFAPTRDTHNPCFPLSLISAYFQADCEALIRRRQPLLWCYGHNHWSDEQRLGRTLIASNQRGYPREHLLVGARYRPKLVYDLDKLVEAYQAAG